jgi:RNA polymerase sigma-70 factor, ECF subfamily
MTSIPPDTDLVAAACRGDRTATDQLLRSHQPMIWAICRRIVGDDHTAADAAQEAMISVVRHLNRFDGRSSVRTWIYRVATNAALDELRRRRRRPDPVSDEVMASRAGTSPSGASVIDDRLLIDEALAQLSPDFRAAVVLRDLVDLDYAEIGEVLGLPPGTVRSRIARGRRVLAEHLSDASGNSEPTTERPTDGSPAEPPLP